jgi:hypothetical protein
MKIVINNCFGGFGLSEKAIEYYNKLANTKVTRYWDIPRNDPHLVQVVEVLGSAAGDAFAKLKIVDVPDGVEWYIHKYDGMESVHEEHRIWD